MNWLKKFLRFAFVSAACGCAANSEELSEKVTATHFSNLAGEWSITQRQFFEGLYSEEAKRSMDSLGTNANRQLLFVTINPDGSFDWSKTYQGVTRGYRNLKQAGDRSTAIGSPTRCFEVSSAQYTPTKSHVSIREGIRPVPLDAGFRVADTARPWELVATLDEGGELLITVVEGVTSQVQRKERVYRARRLRPTPNHECNSQLSGSWAFKDENSGREVVLISIREDGRFDWTGTAEGRVCHFYEISETGGESFPIIFPGARAKVLSANYTPTSSSIGVRLSDGNWLRSSNQLLTLNAMLNADGTAALFVRLTEKVNDRTVVDVSREFRLLRAPADARRIDNLMDFIRGNKIEPKLERPSRN